MIEAILEHIRSNVHIQIFLITWIIIVIIMLVGIYLASKYQRNQKGYRKGNEK